MRYLAKNFSVKTLISQVIFVAIIAVSIAGVARHSPRLEWSVLVATLVLLVADPLTSRNRASATPRVEKSAIQRKILAADRTGENSPVSVALINP